DLDIRRQQHSPLEWIRALNSGPPDRRHGRIEASLRQPQLRQPWLWLPSGMARRTVCLLCTVEVALEPEQLGLAVEGKPGRRTAGLDEAPTRFAGLLECVSPRSAQLQDLGAVDEAATGEGDHVRLCPAPAVERQRPLSCAAQLEDLLAREDDFAVGDAGDDRRQVLGRQ